jgi:CBS domain-containing protein
MKARDVMTRHVECIAPEATVQGAAARMESLNVGSLPICEEARLIGMITDRDIVLRSVAAGHDPKLQRVHEVMTHDVTYCFDNQEVAEISEIMSQKQIRRLPVLNRDKQLVGIISLGDLAVETGNEKLAGHALEGISEHAIA